MTSISSVSAAFRDPVSALPRAARAPESQKANAGASVSASTSPAAPAKAALATATPATTAAASTPPEAGAGRTLGTMVDCKV